MLKKNSSKKPKKIVEKIFKQETKISKNIFNLTQNRIENVKATLTEFLKNIPPKDIIGYGASTKGNIVLNHLKLTSKIGPV